MTELSKEKITAKLDELEIEYDKRLGAEKLAELLPDEALAELTEPEREPADKQQKAEPTVTCRVLRDYWPTDDENDRVRKGAVVDVPVSVALDGVEAGSLQRMKG